METKIILVGISIGLRHRYPEIRQLCREYLAPKGTEVRFWVSASEEQIREEEQQADQNYADGILEATCLHRAIVRALVSDGILLIHSAVVAVDGEAYVFLAKSGVGKSTHIRQWRKVFGERAFVVNGDKPFFSFVGERLMVHGSPWRGKEGWGANTSVPVKAFCFVERGEENRISPAEPSWTINRLMQQMLLPDNREDQQVFFLLISRMVSNYPFYRMQCTISSEAAEMAYAQMVTQRPV